MTALYFQWGPMGQAILGVVGPNFCLYFFLKISVSFRLFRNYMKFDNSLMIEPKIVYLFPSDNII